MPDNWCEQHLAALPLALLSLAVVLPLGACESGHIPGPITTRDSAGVMIVENSAPTLATGEWFIRDTASQVYGATRDDAGVALFSVSGALRLADGRVAVADGGSHSVKIFSADGELETSFGTEGNGPGEFRSIDDIFLVGRDSLVAYDATLMTAHFFDSDGTFHRSMQIQGSRQYPLSRLLPLPDMTFLLTQDPARGALGPFGRFRQPAPYLRLMSDGSVIDTLGSFPGTEVFRSPDAVGTVGMGASTYVVVGPRSVFVGTAEHAEVREFAPTGRLIRVLRWTHQDERVTDDVIEEFVDFRLDAMGVSDEARTALAAMFVSVPFPDVLPPYEDIVVSRNGDLWIREHSGARSDAPIARTRLRATWQVLNPKGLWLGSVQTPAGLDALEIGSDYVLGLHTDELGIETVQVFELVTR